MFKISGSKNITQFDAMPGDTVVVEAYNPIDEEWQSVTHNITARQTINYLEVGLFEDEFGCRSGFYGVFGERNT